MPLKIAFLLPLAAVLCIACKVSNMEGESIVLGTFNVEWLGDGNDDKKPRSLQDFYAVASVIKASRADVLALQEVENEDALRNVISHVPGWHFVVDTATGLQRTALAFCERVRVDSVQSYLPVAVVPGKTRPALTALCRTGSLEFFVMVVHLKSTSRYDSTPQLREYARLLRTKQVGVIVSWVDSMHRYSSVKNLVIMGDFNDYPDRKHNATLTGLMERSSMHFISRHLRSCKKRRWRGIDHIVLSQSLLKLVDSNSIRNENFFTWLPPELALNVSDHCPVTVSLKLAP